MKNLTLTTLLISCLAGLLVFFACKKDKDDDKDVLKDADGNVYTSVVIGTQEWMKENLRTTRYRNGDPITHAVLDSDWKSITEGKYSIYDNDPANVDPFGHLYSWAAVADPRHLCPAGWHVSTRGDWDTLISFLGGQYDAGIAIMQTGTVYWDGPNNPATNQTGFTAVPGGNRNPNTGEFYGKGGEATWWTSEEHPSNPTQARRYFIWATNSNLQTMISPKNFGLSVRCVKD
jgi:uncharacterized protein (TIGR02145 family)